MRRTRFLAISALGLFISPSAFAATLLVLNKEDSTLSFVDPANGRTTATVPVGTGPHEVEVSRDGKLAVVSNYGARTPGNSLSVIDLAAKRERQRVDLGNLQRPHGLAIPDSTSAYFTSEVAKGVGRLDLGTGKFEWKLPTGQERTHMVVASRDGRTLVTANIQSDSVSILRLATDGSATQSLVKTGKGPEGLDLSPDQKQLWAANSGDGSVSIVDVAAGKLVRTFDVGTKRSNRLKFTPDGKMVLISDLSGGELVVLDAATQQQKARITIGANPCGILIVPDGSRAYVALAGENRVAVVDLTSLKVTGRIETGAQPDGLAWIP